MRIAILLIFISSQLFCQKKYYFDYSFFVKETDTSKSKNYNSIFLANSKTNEYRLYALDYLDSLSYTLHFGDENGVGFYGMMKKPDFNNVETITTTCKEVFKAANPFKEKREEYDFINFKDTVINDISYFHYAIKSNKSLKYQKRKKIVTIHYIVDKSDSNFLPLTYVSTIYETWKKFKNIPNGYPKTIYFINTEGIETKRMEFEKAIKIDRYITIPNECDYTREEFRKTIFPIISE